VDPSNLEDRHEKRVPCAGPRAGADGAACQRRRRRHPPHRTSPIEVIDAVATDTPAELRTVPGGVQAIDAKQLSQSRARTLTDALEFAPGVVALARFGPEDLRLSIRGSGLNRTGHGRGLMVVMHGMPINAADGNFDPLTVDLWQAARIDVYRGTQAARHGASTLGGVIEVLPRAGREPAEGALELAFGSFGFRRLAARYGAAAERTDLFAAASFSKADGYRRHSASETTKLHVNGGYRWSEDVLTRVFVSAASTASQWPGALTQAEFRADPRTASALAQPRNLSNDIDHVLLSQQTIVQLGAGELRLSLGLGQRDQDHPTPGNILIERARSSVVDLAATQRLGPAELDVGLRGMRTHAQPDRFAYAGPPSSPLAAQRGAIVDSRNQRAENLDAYARVLWPLAAQTRLSLGLVRTEALRRDQPRAAPIANPRPGYQRRYTAWVPSLGVLHELDRNSQLFAGLSRGFEAPSFFDLDGNAPLQADRIPRLNAQRSTTLEAGWRGGIPTMRWNLTAYTARWEGEILRIDAAGSSNPPAVNAGRTLRHGLELGFDWTLAQHAHGSWVLRQRADFGRMRFDGDPVHGDNRVPGTPPRIYRGWLAYASGRGWVFGPTLRAASGTWVDLVNQTRSPGYALWGLRGRYTRGPWTLNADLDNLSDRAWVSSTNVLQRALPGSGVFFPGDGRSAHLSLTREL
jgi:iron complex outermembrane receptor protein